MKYYREFTTKSGRSLVLRQGEAKDAEKLILHMEKVRAESPYLLTYPGEMGLTPMKETAYLEAREEDPRAAELLVLDGDTPVADLGIWPVGCYRKILHRAELGISVAAAYQGDGIGRALMTAAVELARAAGYTSLELSVVRGNTAAEALYASFGFCPYGSLKKGIRLPDGSYQELVFMALDL